MGNEIASKLIQNPDLLFLVFWNGKENPPKMQGFYFLAEPPKSLGMKEKAQKNEDFLDKQNSKEIPKSKEKKIGEKAQFCNCTIAAKIITKKLFTKIIFGGN